MPDLKKAQENKPAGFAWAPVAKAAASAAGRPQAPPAKGRGALIAAAGLLVVGGLAFAFAAFKFGGSADGSAGGARLGGVASAMKIRFARQNDPTGFIKRERASAAGEKMRFDLIKGAADKAAADKAAGGTGVPGQSGEGGEPMNYEEGGASRASGVAAGGGAAGGKGRDDQGGAGGLSGGGAPRLNASASSVNFRGMRRVSGTAGFRSISGRRGMPNKTIQTKGSAANSSSATRADGGPGGSASAGGNGTGAGGVASGRTAAGGAAAGSATGGGGGGGGSGDADTSGIDDADTVANQIAKLLGEAKSDRDKAEDEKKKAIALKALGQDPQAAYHYDRYQKAKKSADEKEAEANRMTAEMAGAAGQIPVTPE